MLITLPDTGTLLMDLQPIVRFRLSGRRVDEFRINRVVRGESIDFELLSPDVVTFTDDWSVKWRITNAYTHVILAEGIGSVFPAYLAVHISIDTLSILPFSMYLITVEVTNMVLPFRQEVVRKVIKLIPGIP